MKALLLYVSAILGLSESLAPLAAQPASPPFLHIIAGTNEAILSWPTNAGGFVLERATSLATPISWVAATNQFGISGTNLVFAVPGSNSTSSFYRLHWLNPDTSPIVAPADTWTWVTFTNAYCMGGTPLGIGVNPGTNTTNLLIYLTGGGACWDEDTCYVLDTATQGPFGEAEFNEIVPLLDQGWIFSRTNETNPFKDYSYVYVPYCTGDVHAGSRVLLYSTNVTMQVGYLNMTAYLQRLVPTFPGVQHIALVGSSAGGFGAAFNWAQTQKAFGNVRVDLIDDSGPILPSDTQAEGFGVHLPGGEAYTNWNLNAALPTGCATCPTETEALYSYIATNGPAHRSALLSYTQDTVIPSYLGITTSEFTTGLDELVSSEFSSFANTAYFFVGASGHTFLLNDSATNTANGVMLQQFLTEMITNSPAWTSEHP